MKLKDLSIKKKLGLVFFILMFSLVIAITASYYTLRTVRKSYFEMRTTAVPHTIAILETKAAFQRVIMELQSFAAGGDQNEHRQFEQAMRQLEGWLEKCQYAERSVEEQKVSKKLLEYKKCLKKGGKKIFLACKNKCEKLEQLEQLEKHVKEHYLQCMDNIENMSAEQHHALDDVILVASRLQAKTLNFIVRGYEERNEAEQLTKMENSVLAEQQDLKELLKQLVTTHEADRSLKKDLQQSPDLSSAILTSAKEILDIIRDLEDHKDELIETLNNSVLINNKELDKLTRIVAATLQHSTFIITVLPIIFFVSAVPICYCIANLILSSISNLLESTKIIAKGNFAHRTKKIANDETGQLSDYFNKMAEDLEKTTTSIENLNAEVAERKKAEYALETTNKDLQDTIGKLNDSNEKLEEFVHIASHDLREPARKVSSFGQLLAESLAGKLTDDEQEDLGFMIDGADRMMQMIQSLLVYSRITTKAVTLEEIDLNEVIEHLKTFELAHNLEESKGDILVPERLPSVKGDATQIRQLLQNIISNALKYHKETVLPQVTIRGHKQDNDTIYVEAEDNGIGIKQEYFDNIFVMFRRLHSKSDYDGTGIGLAICKKIVERHDGEIGVRSTYGQGSRFWFTLAAADTQHKEEKQLVSSFEI